MNWQENILETGEQIRDLLLNTKRIAVLGIKTEAQADQPSVYVPKYMQDAGFEIVPVPVYYPEVTTILGEKVYRKLVDIPGDIDMVDVFRRSQRRHRPRRRHLGQQAEIRLAPVRHPQRRRGGNLRQSRHQSGARPLTDGRSPAVRRKVKCRGDRPVAPTPPVFSPSTAGL